MSVTVFGHQHDAPLILEGVGTHGAVLIIQAGTLILNFQGVAGEDWIRDRLRHAVLDLPPGIGSLSVVRAVASAAPASMNYSPAPAAGSLGGQGLFAQGNVVLGGYADPSGAVNVGGPVYLPVTGGGPGSTTVSIAGAGWAVDRTRATRVQNQVQLEIDLAIAGPASLLRVAYSLFVTVESRLITEVELKLEHIKAEP